MLYLITHPIFLFGFIIGFIFSIVYLVFKEDKNKKLIYNRVNSANALAEKVISVSNDGENVNIDVLLNGQSVKSGRPIGYLIWESLAFWVAKKFADYEFSGENVELFWNTVDKYFTGTAAYNKMEALVEIINRSTKYYVSSEGTYLPEKEKDRQSLYLLVEKIIDSYYPDVYEHSRIK